MFVSRTLLSTTHRIPVVRFFQEGERRKEIITKRTCVYIPSSVSISKTNSSRIYLRVVPRRVPVANGYPDFFKCITRNRDRVPVPSATRIRIGRVSRQQGTRTRTTYRAARGHSSGHAQGTGRRKKSMEERHGPCGDDEAIFVCFVFALFSPPGNLFFYMIFATEYVVFLGRMI